jgi:sugar (pentulose or hexulose) kinase
MSGFILSHDLGTTGDKATLVDAEGHVVAAVTATYDTDFGPRGKAEQDAEAWWRARSAPPPGSCSTRCPAPATAWPA